jgi:prepilin-type N-terminal cleavage/methylation domain-containing protein
MKVMNSKIKSFTLIELLVVISIIGLLSSIVLVATKGSREKARIAKILETSQTIHTSLGSEAVGVWDFDNCTASDSSGYGNNGTINGATCSSDTPYSAIGQGTGKNSMSFDGSNDWVDCGNDNSIKNPTDITISFWVKVIGAPASDYVGLVSKGYVSVGSWDFAMTTTRTGYFFIRKDIGGYSYPRALGGEGDPWTPLPIGTWVHMAGVIKDKDYIALYRNGELHKYQDIDWSVLISTYNVSIGRDYSSGTVYFNGLIDDVRIYSQALTQSQIQQQYVEGLKTHNDLVLLDE